MKKIRFLENYFGFKIGEIADCVDDGDVYFYTAKNGENTNVNKQYPHFKYEIIEDNMITGKEALIALANGEEVGYLADGDVWFVDKYTPLGVFDSFKSWKVKPRTITLNGVEVPAPFEPKIGDKYWRLAPAIREGYTSSYDEDYDTQFGAWQTEDEIKQVVEALRSIFATA